MNLLFIRELKSVKKILKLLHPKDYFIHFKYSGFLEIYGCFFIDWKDLVSKIRYNNRQALGLVISSLGTLLFYSSANTESHPLLLAGLFSVGPGF